MATYRERPISQLAREPNDWSKGERLNEQELNAVFIDSESSYDAHSILSTATKPLHGLLSKLDSHHCSNPICNKKLIFNRRSCYMCGRNFCFECTSHSRELGGSLRQTCAPCFADLHVRQQPGYQRDFKGFFRMHRGTKKTQPQNGFQKPVPDQRKKRFTIDVRKELERLCAGFSESTTTRLKSSLNELVNTAKMPKWQQGRFWQPGSEVKACHTCWKELSFLSLSKQYCRICGRVFCSECTAPLLMLYRNVISEENVLWAINGLEGCPSAEPPVFQLFRICRSCQSLTEQLLVERTMDLEKVEEMETNVGFMDKLLELYTSLLKHKLYILSALPSFVRRVEGLAESSDSGLARELSKQQTDLSDHFSLLAVELQGFRFLEAGSSRQHAILNNASKAFLSFYHEYMPTFRCVTRDLHDIFTPEVMKVILDQNNYSILNAAYLVIRQLCLELTYIFSEFKMSQDLFDKLGEASDVIVVELKSVVEKRGDDWPSHKSAISEMVKTQYKQKPFVIVGKQKCLYTEKEIHQKVVKKLLICVRKLEARTDEKSFVDSKRILTSILFKKTMHRGVTI